MQAWGGSNYLEVFVIGLDHTLFISPEQYRLRQMHTMMSTSWLRPRKLLCITVPVREQQPVDFLGPGVPRPLTAKRPLQGRQRTPFRPRTHPRTQTRLISTSELLPAAQCPRPSRPLAGDALCDDGAVRRTPCAFCPLS